MVKRFLSNPVDPKVLYLLRENAGLTLSFCFAVAEHRRADGAVVLAERMGLHVLRAEVLRKRGADGLRLREAAGEKDVRLLRRELLRKDRRAAADGVDAAEDDIARRRQGFYQRCGFAVNPYPHVHPPYRPEYPGHELVVLSSPRALTPAEYGAFACYLSAVVMA